MKLIDVLPNFSSIIVQLDVEKMQEYLSKRESQISAVKEGKAMLIESEYTDALEKCCAQSWERWVCCEFVFDVKWNI